MLNIRKLAALVLLLTMPLQGIAASLSALLCAPVVAGAAYSSNGGDGTTPEPVQDDIQKFSEHLFCNQLYSGIPVVPARTPAVDFSVVGSPVSLLSSLFFPLLPQRPPLFSAHA